MSELETIVDGLLSGDLSRDDALAQLTTASPLGEAVENLDFARIEAGYFAAKFGADILARFGEVWTGLEREGLLEVEGGTLRLTRPGLLQVDGLLPRFYHADYRQARYT